VIRQFTLGKNERLKSRKLIEQLFREKKAFNAFPFKVFYLFGEKKVDIKPSPINIQFGVGVSSKNFKKAVDRNRIKRLAREAYRLQKKILQETMKDNSKSLFVFFIYTQKELPDYKTIYEKTSLILDKLVKIINESNSSDT
jgi:ribonuclease P protein component